MSGSKDFLRNITETVRKIRPFNHIILEGSSCTGKSSFVSDYYDDPMVHVSHCDYEYACNSSCENMKNVFSKKGCGSSLTRNCVNQVYTSMLTTKFVHDLLVNYSRVLLMDRAIVSNIVYDCLFDSVRERHWSSVSDEYIDYIFSQLINEGLLFLPDVQSCLLNEDGVSQACMLIFVRDSEEDIELNRQTIHDQKMMEIFGGLEEYGAFQDRWWKGFVRAITKVPDKEYNIHAISIVKTLWTDKTGKWLRMVMEQLTRGITVNDQMKHLEKTGKVFTPKMPRPQSQLPKPRFWKMASPPIPIPQPAYQCSPHATCEPELLDNQGKSPTLLWRMRYAKDVYTEDEPELLDQHGRPTSLYCEHGVAVSQDDHVFEAEDLEHEIFDQNDTALSVANPEEYKSETEWRLGVL